MHSNPAQARYRATEKGRAAQRRHVATYQQVHPEKVKAKDAANHALRMGRILRQGCEVCGDRAQMHHDDYTKPLEVRWLCRTHHRLVHA